MARGLALCLALWALAPAPARGTSPRPSTEDGGRVTVPLSHYLELQQRIEELEREKGKEKEPALAELVSQETTVTVGEPSAANEDAAQLTTVFQVEIRGDYREPLVLPLTGLAETVSVDPAAGAALHRTAAGELELVPEQPGTYRVRVEGARTLERDADGRRLTLTASPAPVAATWLDLPAGLDWRSAGAVVVAEQADEDRRRLRLALPRDRDVTVTLGRRLDEDPLENALVQTVTVTVLDLDANGTRRHDIVLYEVLRGEISSFEVELPPGLEVEQVGSDEGDAAPVRSADRLTVHRERRLSGTGYLVLTSPAPASGTVPMAPVRPSVPVRAHYLVLASSVAADVTPQPDAAWSQVDLGDLPSTVREDLRTLRPTAAWRRVTDSEGDLRVALDPLPPAPTSGDVIRRRENTTLLTREGSLVHQDRYVLQRVLSAFEVELPAGLRLWSATVDGDEVRPVVRGDRLAIPLTLQGEAEARVEVVFLEREKLPERRAQIGITLPQVGLPVLEHRWRLLLPETHRYRYEEGSLPIASQGAVDRLVAQPAAQTVTRSGLNVFEGEAFEVTAGLSGRVVAEDGSPLPGVVVALTGRALSGPRQQVTDELGRFHFPPVPDGHYQVTAQLEGFQTVTQSVQLREQKAQTIGLVLPLAAVAEEILVTADATPPPAPGKRELAKRAEDQRRRLLLDQEVALLNQGLVGGVRPLPVEIPETGKLLFLAGALPPEQVTVRLSVKDR